MKRIFISLSIIYLLTNSQINKAQQHFNDKWPIHSKRFEMIFNKRDSIQKHYYSKAQLKAASENKSLLDSTYEYIFNSSSDSFVSTKHYYTYDVHGNNISEIEYEFDKTTKQWICSSKNEYNYDSKMNDTLSIYYTVDKTTDQLINYSKRKYYYDANGKDTLYITYQWSQSNNKWIGDTKNENIYETNGNGKTVNTYITYTWDNVTMQWITWFKNQNIIDINADSSLSIDYEWDNKNNKWQNYSKNETIKNSKGKDTLSISYNWDIDSNKWVGVFKSVYDNDAYGNDTLSITYSWDKILNNWTPTSKYKRDNDKNGNDTLSINYNWDKINNKWISLDKSQTKYDINGKEVSFLYYDWKQSTNKWEKVFEDNQLHNMGGHKIIYFIASFNSFDNPTSFVSGIEELGYDSNENHILDIIYSRDNDTSQMEISSKVYYFNSIHNVSNNIQVSKFNILKLYPNPANNLINLETTDNSETICRLFNNQGQLVMSMNAKFGNNAYYIDKLKSGLYIMQVQTINGIISYKLIKE